MKRILRKTIKRATTPAKTISAVIRAGRIARIGAEKKEIARKFSRINSFIDARARNQRNLAKSLIEGKIPLNILKDRKQAKDIMRRLRDKKISPAEAVKKMLVLVKRQ